MTIIGDAYIKVGSIVDRFEADLRRKIDPAVKSVSASITNDFGGALEGIGDDLTDNLSRPAAAVAAASQLVFDSYHRGFEQLRQDTGETGDALDDLLDSTKNVARNVTVPFADVAAVLAEVRIRTQLTGAPLERLTQQVIELAEVTGGDAAGNVELYVKLLTSWNVATLDQAAALDLLFRASQRTGNGIEGIAASALEARIFLQGLGFTFEETIALVANLGGAFPRFLAALKIGIANLSRAGVNDIPAAFADVVDSINSAGSAAEANRRSIEVFGSRAGPYIAGLIREGKLEFQDFARELENGRSTIHATAEETRTWTDQLVRVRNAIVGNIGPIGEWGAIIGTMAAGAGPLFTGLGKAIGPPVRAIQELRRYSIAVEAPLTAVGAATELVRIQLDNAGRGARNFIGNLTRARVVAGATKIAFGILAAVGIQQLISGFFQAGEAADELVGRMQAAAGAGTEANARMMREFRRAADEAVRDVKGLGDEFSGANNPFEFLKAAGGELKELVAGDDVDELRKRFGDLRREAAAMEGTQRDLNLALADAMEAELNYQLVLAGRYEGTKTATELDRIRADAMAELNSVVEVNTSETTSNATATDASTAADERKTVSLRDIRNAHREAAQAARDQIQAELSLAGGILGIQGASLSAKDAQERLVLARRQVQRLEGQGRQGTLAHKDAVDELAQAQLAAAGGQLGLAQAVAQFVDENKRSGATASTAVKLVEEYGQKAGLTSGEIGNLTGNVRGLISEYREIPVSKTTRVDFEDEIARRKIARLHRELDELRRPVNIPVNVGAGAAGGAAGDDGVVSYEESKAYFQANPIVLNNSVHIDGKKVQESNGRRDVLLGGD